MKKEKQDTKARSKGAYIFRTKITINGATCYAKDYGKKAFRIPV